MNGNGVELYNIISLGNLLTIITIIFGLIINMVITTYRISKFITVTEMKFSAGERKFHEHDCKLNSLEDKCKTCPQVIEIKYLKTERERMNNEQVLLRGQLPLQINSINTSIEEVKDEITKIRVELEKKGVI